MMLYLCGGIAGIGTAREIFRLQERLLIGVGYDVLNPYDIDPVELDGTSDWSANLRGDISKFLRFAVGIATIEGWQRSPGASLEVEVATRLEIPVKTVNQWLRDKGWGVLNA